MNDRDRPDQASSETASETETELRKLVLEGSTVEGFLADLSTLAAEIVDGACCGFSLDRDGQTVTVAATAGGVAWLDEVQYLSGDGPVLTALRTCSRVDLPSLADEQRWGDFATRALAFGVGSGVFLPLMVRGEAVGVLSLYAAGAGALSEADVRRAQVIAEQAAAGLTLLLGAGVVPDDHLREALVTRRQINRALGVLMHARRIGTAEALDVLLDKARRSSRSPDEVARDVIASTTDGDGDQTE